MHNCLRTLLIAGLLAGCFPQAFCFCGRGAALGQRVAPMCPCCRLHKTAPAHNQRPTRCCCDEVREISAVPPGAAVAVPALALSGHVHQADAVATSVSWAICHLPERGTAAGPPGSIAGPGRALPIFLGHLLI